LHPEYLIGYDHKEAARPDAINIFATMLNIPSLEEWLPVYIHTWILLIGLVEKDK
jgi:hypothetical protein